jgi:DNA-binding protein YbaB
VSERGAGSRFAGVLAGLVGRELTETAPGGEVRVVVDLRGELCSVWLHPAALRGVDRFTLGELVAATVRAAQVRAGEELAEALRQARDQTSMG